LAKRITVLGIGNLLLRDEGVGIHVIEALKKEYLPENVELVDGAAGGFDLLPLILACDKLIVIDAIKTGDEPGAIYKFDSQDIDIQRDVNVSLHDVDFFQVLEHAKKYKTLPPVEMITIVPKEMSLGMELSSCVVDKLPKLIELVKQEITKENNSNNLNSLTT